jgi:hypothetical protein
MQKDLVKNTLYFGKYKKDNFFLEICLFCHIVFFISFVKKLCYISLSEICLFPYFPKYIVFFNKIFFIYFYISNTIISWDIEYEISNVLKKIKSEGSIVPMCQRHFLPFLLFIYSWPEFGSRILLDCTHVLLYSFILRKPFNLYNIKSVVWNSFKKSVVWIIFSYFIYFMVKCFEYISFILFCVIVPM